MRFLKLNRQRAFFLLLGIAAALLSAYSVSDLMRESDQASILTGVWKLYKGSSISGENYYNYDKLYISYWLLAAALRLRSWFAGLWSPVLIANVCTWVVFWLCILMALFRITQRRGRPPLFALLCFLGTPVILLNSVYANAATISAGFLILAGVLKNPSLAAFFFFLAVGARADAILLAPLLIWLHTPPRRWLAHAVRGARTWYFVLASITALALGNHLYTGVRWDTAFFDPHFAGRRLSLLLAYSVFGLGPSLVMLTSSLLAMIAASWHTSQLEKRLFRAAGAFCLALPFLFYSLQLYSPRYLILSALAVFLLGISQRGIALWRAFKSHRPFIHATRGLCLVMALLLVIGLRIPAPTQPGLTLSRPTLFPTTDGLYPMGAWLPFLLSMRRRDIDHNQMVWQAAQSARYQPSHDSLVHALDTPMFSYLELATTVKGLQIQREKEDTGQALYVDSRSLLRVGSGQEGNSSSTATLLMKPSQIVSSVYQGTSILRFNAGNDYSWGLKTILLNRLMAANDYIQFQATRFNRRGILDGRPFTFIAEAPFQVLMTPNQRAQTSIRDDTSGLFYLPVSRTADPVFRVLAERPDRVILVIQSLPGWMSVRP